VLYLYIYFEAVLNLRIWKGRCCRGNSSGLIFLFDLIFGKPLLLAGVSVTERRLYVEEIRPQNIAVVHEGFRCCYRGKFSETLFVRYV